MVLSKLRASQFELSHFEAVTFRAGREKFTIHLAAARSRRILLRQRFAKDGVCFWAVPLVS